MQPLPKPCVLLIERDPTEISLVERAVSRWCPDCSLVVVLPSEAREMLALGGLPGLCLILFSVPLRTFREEQFRHVIEETPALRETPVVLLTTLHRESDAEIAAELGIAEVVEKPVDYHELLETLRRVFERHSPSIYVESRGGGPV